MVPREELVPGNAVCITRLTMSVVIAELHLDIVHHPCFPDHRMIDTMRTSTSVRVLLHIWLSPCCRSLLHALPIRTFYHPKGELETNLLKVFLRALLIM